MAFPEERPSPPGGTPTEARPSTAWAAPDAPASPDGPAGYAVPVVAAPSGASGAGPGAPSRIDSHLYNEIGVRLPVPLRPMAVADVLDGAFTIIKSRPRTIFGIALPILLPLLLFQAWMQRYAFSSWTLVPVPMSGPTSSATSSSSLALGYLGALVVAALLNLALYLVGAGIARVVSAWYAGGDIGPAEALRAVGSRIGPLMGLWALQGLGVIVCILLAYCAIGMLVLPVYVAFFSFTAPIVMMEKVGPIDAMRRSWRLASKRGLPVIGITLLVVLVQSLATAGLTTMSSAILVGTFAAGEGEVLGLVAAGIITTLVSVFMTPYVTGASVLLYLDQRIRSEGLDLELEAADAFS